MRDRALVNAYRRDGVAVIRDVFDRTDLGIMRRELDRLEALNLFQDSSISKRGTSHELSQLDLYSPVFRALLFDNRVLDLARSVIDTPFALHIATSFMKRAKTGLGTRWHADDALHPEHHPPHKAFGMWIAVDPVSANNAPLMLVPGSKRGDAKYVADPESNYRPYAVMTPELERRRTTPLLPAGSVVLFSYDTLHATGDNTTGRDRRAVSFHFLSVDQFSPTFPVVTGRFPYLTSALATSGEREYGRSHAGAWEALRRRKRPFGSLNRPAAVDEVMRLCAPVETRTRSRLTAEQETLTASYVLLPLGKKPIEHRLSGEEHRFLRSIDDEATLGEIAKHVAGRGGDLRPVAQRLAAFAGVLRDYGILQPT